MNTQRVFIALMLAGFFAFTAVGASYAQVSPTTPLAANFVDADGDGVCDNAGQALGTMARQGRRSMAQGQAQAQMQNFVDEDGDGVCDVCGQAAGTGQGQQGQRLQNQNSQNQLGQGGQGQMLRLHQPGTGGQMRQGQGQRQGQ